MNVNIIKNTVDYTLKKNKKIKLSKKSIVYCLLFHNALMLTDTRSDLETVLLNNKVMFIIRSYLVQLSNVNTCTLIVNRYQ